jgi:response regulator RpfG family c-di-GMP phosphodiesterase
MKKILLVDDEQNVLNALQRELKDLYEIKAFDSPVAALEHSRNMQFDLVIADYKMPEMNGIEFLKQFGQIQPDASRVVLSGEADLDMLIRMINETHIYRFLTKPWKRDELLSSIQQALDYRDTILESHHQVVHRECNAATQTSQNGSIFRIVLVDSDDYLLKLMSRELADINGHESLYRTIQQEIKQETPPNKFKFIINIFHSAQAALAHAKNNSVDLIISAQTLSDMEGIKLLGKVQHVLPNTALILLGDDTDKSVLMQAINEADVQNLLLLHWENSELRSDARRQAWNLHQLRTAAIQALASRSL